MKNYFLIILFLLAFNANALAGVVMMSEMVFATKGTAVLNHDSDSHGHANTSMDQSTLHVKMTKQVSIDCSGDEDCNACIAHCTSALILIENADFNIQNPSGFTSGLISFGTTSDYFRLLRPPKFS